MGFRLLSSTHPRWFEASSADLPALLSDHLHCERKAAENALSLVRRYPHRGASVEKLGRLAHEETSHVVQVGALLGRGGGRSSRGGPPSGWACWRAGSPEPETASWPTSTRRSRPPKSATPRSSSS